MTNSPARKFARQRAQWLAALYVAMGVLWISTSDLLAPQWFNITAESNECD